MADFSWKHAFATFPLAKEDEAVQGTVIKVIDTDPEKHADMLETGWPSDLKMHGLHVSFLSRPCLLHKVKSVNGEKDVICEMEIKHAFIKSFWRTCQSQPVAAAICVSHLRALHEALMSKEDVQVIIIVEGDVRATKNTENMFAAVLANLYGNKHLKKCQYMALSFSDWHSGHANKARLESTSVPESMVKPYCKVTTLPFLEDKNGNWRYAFVGQGARAIAYRAALARELLDEKVGSFWDMHLLNFMSNKRCKAWCSGADEPFMACLVDPPVWHHVPDFADRFRGSGRLAMMASSAAEQTSHYITVDLSHQWGIANRLQTLCLLCGVAGLHRLGVYCLWTETDSACHGARQEAFSIDTSSQVYQDLPFLTFYKSAQDSNWLAAKNSDIWCMGNFYSQCQVDMGINFVMETRWAIARAEKDVYYHNVIYPYWVETLTESYCWQLVQLAPTITSDACVYLQPKTDEEGHRVSRHVAVHVRRGDHKYMTSYLQMDPKKSQDELPH